MPVPNFPAFFFFPEINLKPTLIQEVSNPKTIEIFAAPSCPHCEEAIKRLCENTGAELVVRPVSISSKDGGGKCQVDIR